jgi:hypothetical protein
VLMRRGFACAAKSRAVGQNKVMSGVAVARNRWLRTV